MKKDAIIETFNLSKTYHLKGRDKHINALKDVNISIKKGEIFGLLGPNGAGKTTLIQILTTLLHPTSGYAIIDGHHLIKDAKKVKSKIALMLESDMLYHRITAHDNLKFFCKLYQVPKYEQKILEMSKIFGIEKWLNQYVEHLSSGMKMKLALARTLLLERDILFLDEPTLGLDVKTVNLFIDIIKNVGSTVIFTSHDLSVVEKLCDRIAFINDGKIIKIWTQDEIKNLAGPGITVEIFIDSKKQELISELRDQDFLIENSDHKNENILAHLKERNSYKDLLNILRNYEIMKIKETEPSLEDLFLKFLD